MTYILSALVVMGQAIVGLIWLAALSLIGFIIADVLGLVGPVGNEKPNARWLRRQQKAQCKLWGDSAITKRTLAKHIGKEYAWHRKLSRLFAKEPQLGSAETQHRLAHEWQLLAYALKDNKIGESRP